jgi:hypothetical protein
MACSLVHSSRIDLRLQQQQHAAWLVPRVCVLSRAVTGAQGHTATLAAYLQLPLHTPGCQEKENGMAR